MKTSVACSGLLLLTLLTSAQRPGPDESWLTVSPRALAGKRVATTISLKKLPGPAAPAPGSQAMVMTGPTEQTIARVLYVRPDKASNALALEQTVKHVRMTIESPLGKSVYDSDNAFERDLVTAALSQRYDPFINKTQKSQYGNPAAKQTSPDAYFEGLWTMHLPALVPESALQGVLLPRLPRQGTPGTTWTDTVRTDKSTTINRYQVLSQDGPLLRLRLDSRLLPGSALRNQASSGNASASSTTDALTFAGEVTVQQATGLIQDLRVTKQSSVTVNSSSGKSLQNQTAATVEVHNSVE